MCTLFQDSWSVKIWTFPIKTSRPNHLWVAPECSEVLPVRPRWSPPTRLHGPGASSENHRKSTSANCVTSREQCPKAAASYRCVLELCMLFWEIHSQSSRTERWDASRNMVHHHTSRRLDICQDYNSPGVFSTKDALDAIDASVAVSVRLWSNMPMRSILNSRIVRIVIIVTICNDV